MFTLVGAFFSCTTLAASDAASWNTEKSTHFIVYYKNAPQNFVKELVDKAEDYYNAITDNLGFRRFNFWLWDNRAKVYIYNDKDDYSNSTGVVSWSAGFAVVQEKAIHTYPYAKSFSETILPHEMGHIIFREFIGFGNQLVPVWLDEGVACFQEKGRAENSKAIVIRAINDGSFIDITKLNSMDPRGMSDHQAVNLFYAESVTIVSYLVKHFGRDGFVSFCQHLRDGKTVEEALRSAYGIKVKDLKELNENWVKYLKNG